MDALAFSSENCQVHPPRSKPSLRSSSAPPGPCITPSSDRCAKAIIFLIFAILPEPDFLPHLLVEREAIERSYEKVKKIKADVAAFSYLFPPIAYFRGWRAVKGGAVRQRSSCIRFLYCPSGATASARSVAETETIFSPTSPTRRR